jgi:hypothetical protein
VGRRRKWGRRARKGGFYIPPNADLPFYIEVLGKE